MGQRIPERPVSQRHPPDRHLKLGPVKVQLRADQVDIGPVGLLDHIRGRDGQRFGQGLVKGQGGLVPRLPQPVLLLHGEGVILGEQGEDGGPFIRHLAAHDRGHGALAVEVDHQHLVTIQRRRHRQMRRSRGLADAALEIGDRRDLGGQALGPVGQVFLGGHALGREMVSQRNHLLEREPFGAVRPFALRQVGVVPEHPAEMGGCDGQKVAADFPGGEFAQTLGAIRGIAALGQIGAAPFAKGGGLGESGGIHRLAQFRSGTGGVEVLIGRCIEILLFRHCRCLPRCHMISVL